MNINLKLGDCTKVLATLDEGSVGNIVSDPPYGLEFMGKDWDRLDSFSDLKRPDIRQPGQSNYKDSTHNPYGRSKVRYGVGNAYGASNSGQGQQAWHMGWLKESFRVLKSGGQIKAFSGTRTFHRLAAAMEQAGFVDIRLEAWCYGSGFPKSLNIAKSMDAQGGSVGLKAFDRQAFAKLLTQHREAAGVSRSEMASWFEYAEVTKNWERLDDGFRTPSESDCQVLIEKLGMPPQRNLPTDQRKLVSTNGIDRREDGTVLGLGHSGVEWESTTPDAKMWEGWGTALKPAWEPVVVGRKP